MVSFSLYRLLQKDTMWTWIQKEADAFTEAKMLLLSTSILAHYNPEKPLIMSVDASPYGLVSHRMTEGSNRPVSFASHTLSVAEKNYSQI